MSVERHFNTLKVTQVTEFETYKNLPKYVHVPYAVIHPSPRKKKALIEEPSPNFKLSGSSAKLQLKKYEPKQLPEHLMRAPMDSGLSSSSFGISPKKKPTPTGSPHGRPKSLKQEKMVKETAKKMDNEMRKLKKADKNVKDFYADLKRDVIDKANEEDVIREGSLIKVKEAKHEAKGGGKQFIRFLYTRTFDKGLHETRTVLKEDFIKFIKIFKQNITDSDVSDMYFYIGKKLSPLQYQNIEKSDSFARSSLKEKGKPGPKKSSAGLTALTDQELRDWKLDLAMMDIDFFQWFQKEESLSGVLNIKVIKAKNADLRTKLEVWKKREEERRRLKRRSFEHGKKLREVFEKSCNDINMEKEKVQECIIHYNQYMEDKNRLEKEEKIIIGFLCLIPGFTEQASVKAVSTTQVLEIKDLERVLDNETKVFKQEMNVLREFSNVVRFECVLNQYFFSFYDIPDLIVKKKYQRKEYDQIIKLLNKVKKAYLVQKSLMLPDKKVSEIEITDEDLVPLELFDEALSQKENKFKEKRQYLIDMIQEAKSKAKQTIESMGTDSITDKTRKIVENSVFIGYLNQRLESTHQKIFSFNYCNQRLYYDFYASQSLYQGARHFESAYYDCLNCEYESNKYNKEWRERLQVEMQKFCGKIQGLSDAAESISDATSEDKKGRGEGKKSALKSDKQSVTSGPQKQTTFAGVDKEQQDIIDVLNERRGSNVDDDINFRDTGFERGLIHPVSMDPYKELGKGLGQIPKSPRDQWADEEEDMYLRQEEEKKKKAYESPNKQLFRDNQGNLFDPQKKFGLIQDNSLIYDNVTSSYPLNLPTDYYLKYVQGTVPTKDSGKWFIRPHHLESLTEHPQSVKDDVLNTRYYSHYNQNYGKKEERNEAEEAIKMIEGHLNFLRFQQENMKNAQGSSAMQLEEQLEEMKYKLQREGQERYERFIQDKNRSDAKELIIEAYEGVLYEKRRFEKELLNGKRFKEFEKNRPPQDRWYELKSCEFSKELYRNRMALKPNDANRVYLKTLQDPYLY